MQRELALELKKKEEEKNTLSQFKNHINNVGMSDKNKTRAEEMAANYLKRCEAARVAKVAKATEKN